MLKTLLTVKLTTVYLLQSLVILLPTLVVMKHLCNFGYWVFNQGVFVYNLENCLSNLFSLKQSSIHHGVALDILLGILKPFHVTIKLGYFSFDTFLLTLFALLWLLDSNKGLIIILKYDYNFATLLYNFVAF